MDRGTTPVLVRVAEALVAQFTQTSDDSKILMGTNYKNSQLLYESCASARRYTSSSRLWPFGINFRHSSKRALETQLKNCQYW